MTIDENIILSFLLKLAERITENTVQVLIPIIQAIGRFSYHNKKTQKRYMFIANISKQRLASCFIDSNYEAELGNAISASLTENTNTHVQKDPIIFYFES